ncbi:MAG TPA: HAMP domain-containing sensor histidine kinase [Vicinamibacterales bacterium]|nr:HAMP domain-containing sensor histidine kinase [Vicinamibacterales bacterium]
MYSRWRDRLRHTLGLRLAVWYAAIFVGSSLALILVTYLLLSASLRQYDREVIQTTLLEYVGAWRRGGVAALESTIRANQAAAGYEPLFVRAVGPFGGVVFLNAPQDWQTFDMAALQGPALGGQQRWTTIEAGRRESLDVLSVRLPDGTLFQVGKSTARRRDLLDRFRTVLIIDFLSLVVIGLAAGAVFTSSAVQPVRALIATVRQIMRTGRIESRVPARGSGDALDELSLLFNAMLDRIEGLIAGMRGSLDNVAHDLRTPMTRMRSIAEAALQSPDDPRVLREALADCLEESERLVTMLDTLMDISEAETGTMKLHREPTNLAELVRSTVDLYEDLAEHKGVRLEAGALEDVVADVDASRMRQVLANLADNAVKYTASGGRVTLTVRREPSALVVGVADTGIGIPAGELSRIWERLYRGDKSRSERGLGLGLSLVKAIVEAHGGQVSAHSEPGTGSRFEVRLPLAS